MATKNPFEDAEVIDSYTDEQAQGDGVLVNLGGVDRATRNLFDQLSTFLGGNDDTALLRLKTLVLQNACEASRVYDQNIGGGIFCLDVAGERAWIIPNELGGMTIMR